MNDMTVFVLVHNNIPDLRRVGRYVIVAPEDCVDLIIVNEEPGVGKRETMAIEAHSVIDCRILLKCLDIMTIVCFEYDPITPKHLSGSSNMPIREVVLYHVKFYLAIGFSFDLPIVVNKR